MKPLSIITVSSLCDVCVASRVICVWAASGMGEKISATYCGFNWLIYSTCDAVFSFMNMYNVHGIYNGMFMCAHVWCVCVWHCQALKHSFDVVFGWNIGYHFTSQQISIYIYICICDIINLDGSKLCLCNMSWWGLGWKGDSIYMGNCFVCCWYKIQCLLWTWHVIGSWWIMRLGEWWISQNE